MKFTFIFKKFLQVQFFVLYLHSQKRRKFFKIYLKNIADVV